MASEAAWSTQQLAEFLAVLSAFPDEGSAALGAVERATEALDAEAGALIRGETIIAASGFAAGATPEETVMAIARGTREEIELEGVGDCAAVAIPLEGSLHDRLVLARRADEPFDRSELTFLRALCRVLVLTLRMLRLIGTERELRERSEQQARENALLLERLRERQALLERLSVIQRSIVQREDRDAVLEAVVDGTCDLLDGAAVLRLVDSDDPETTTLVASRGFSAELSASIAHSRRGVGASGQVIASGRIEIMHDYQRRPDAHPAFAASGLQAAMAAPVHEKGRLIGTLTAGSYAQDRRYSEAEQEALLALAEHASIALTDARMVDDVMHQALHDPLTGLANRALFLDRLERAMAATDRSGGPVAVLFLDLDRFKNVNDTFGHAAGDRLLVEVSERLRSNLRPGDTIARFGGDEFAILLEDGGGGESPIAVARRLLEVVGSPVKIGERTVFVAASIGIAAGTGGEDLLRNADLAMYRAKSQGQARYAEYEPGMHAEMVERLELETDLRRAVEAGELVLHYQPLVELDQGRVFGVEALVRWQHPRRGLVPPGAFIPVAEESGLIVSIGSWVLRTACRQAAEWQRPHGPLTLSVNLSGVQLEQPELVDEVAEVLRDTGLDPAQLVLEITETVLMSDAAAVAERLGELKRLGVRIAVDDFGTGYSSLQYLRGFPLDILKVAKSFVDGLTGTAEGFPLARAIVDLGDSLELDVVGEGIELSEQRERLIELGCELGQGFLFARPATAEGIERLLGSANISFGDLPLTPLEPGVDPSTR